MLAGRPPPARIVSLSRASAKSEMKNKSKINSEVKFKTFHRQTSANRTSTSIKISTVPTCLNTVVHLSTIIYHYYLQIT